MSNIKNVTQNFDIRLINGHTDKLRMKERTNARNDKNYIPAGTL